MVCSGRPLHPRCSRTAPRLECAWYSQRERERERQPSVCVGTTPEATQGGAVHSDPQNSTSHTHLLTHKYTHSLSLHPSLPLSLYIPFEWLSFVFKPEHSLSVSWLSQALLKLPTSHRQRHLREREGGAEVKKASSQMGCQGLAWRAANTHVRLMHSSTNALWIEGGLARAILGVKVKLINAKGIRERFCCKRQICHPRQHHLRSAATKGARESSAFPRPPPTGTTQKHTDTYVAHAV